ncbi:hypothetical protein, partial [Spiroplasma sp. AdecLV25b]|uniref:hypothetical protein n=1 Tax=Spiroplasma sp. AdecLV25b TaxID=3027162 RepID=UPI0027DF00B9
MFKNLWKFFKNDLIWKKIMKICVIYSTSLILSFWFFLSLILIVGIPNNFKNIDKSVFKGFIFVFQTSIISYSLSIFIVNSNEIQQQKYRFLWLFLFFLALNLLGIISILLLLKKQKNKNDVIEIQETPQMIKTEKWFMLWAIYSSVIMMVCIITIPLSIINLINIKKK